MPTDAGQSIVAETKTTEDYIKDAVVAPSGLIIDPPRILEGAAGAAVVAFEDQSDVVFRRIQNCGTTPIYFIVQGKRNVGVDDVPEADQIPGPNRFHGIIAPGSAQDDGLGTVENFKITKGRVILATAAGALRAAPMQYRNPSVNPPQKDA